MMFYFLEKTEAIPASGAASVSLFGLQNTFLRGVTPGESKCIFFICLKILGASHFWDYYSGNILDSVKFFLWLIL